MESVNYETVMKDKFSKDDLADYENVKLIKEEGNQKAIREIYNKYYGKVKSISYTYNIQSDLRDDLVSEIMIKIFDKIDKYNPKGKFSNWVTRMAKNHIMDSLRKKDYRHKINNVISKDSVFDDTDSNSSNIVQLNESSLNVEEQMISAEIKSEMDELINEHISKLNDEEQQILYLKMYNGLSSKEIAQEIGQTVTYCNVKMHRIKKKLKKIVS